jgi:hypothetical protein
MITTPLLFNLLFAGSMLTTNHYAFGSTGPVHKIAEYYEAGPRIRVDDLPEAIQRKYEATGVLRCGTKEGSAQLTSAKDLITTAGHILTNPNTCKQIVRAESCIFIV